MWPTIFSDTSAPIHSRHKGARTLPTRPTPAPISNMTSVSFTPVKCWSMPKVDCAVDEYVSSSV